ncbi:hypothetical protein FZD51_19175 [Bacillus infantis]|uniref:Uncharacterized protein n=1 Tax=Bacillus infantis TaxID=324767 RepID=A0A5D4R7X4_9BACI|nr:hypothetical protein FZD51_19175 [Bacillus infantis]
MGPDPLALKFMNKMIKDDKFISVAQLSMGEASKEVEYTTSKTIINPFDMLISSIVNQLKLDKK